MLHFPELVDHLLLLQNYIEHCMLARKDSEFLIMLAL